MTQPEPTPDDIRAAIAADPQSQADRSYLINKAVHMNMADEIPADWTVEFYDDETDGYDDEDLIAEHYIIEPLKNKRMGQRYPDDPQVPVSINAHESGNVSVSFPPDPPKLKFDPVVADRIIGMLLTVRGEIVSTYGADGPVSHDLRLVEPTTGITVEAITPPPSQDPYQTEDDTYPVITIDSLSYRLTIESLENWLTGFTAMVNTAETYGTERGE